MELVKPDIGLIFWMLVTFSIVLVILRKFAWKPIVNSLKNRENSIDKALNEAKSAREEIANLKAENEKIVQEAKIERDTIIKEAKEKGDEIIKISRSDAEKERKRILEETKNLVRKEKEVAFSEIKSELSEIIIDTASKIIRKELSDKKAHQEIIENSLKDL
jgi:F-type H+-transporting ATPase subunit b